MSDQTLNQSAAITATPIKNLFSRIKSYFHTSDDVTHCLDTSPSDRARLKRGLPFSRRQRQDIGLSEEYSCHDTHNEVANIAARHGMPL